MARTAEQLAQFQARLLEKHPELAQAEPVPLSACFHAWGAVSEFIESCWEETYAGEARIVFSPAYLQFAFGDLRDQSAGVAVRHEGAPVSLVLGTEICYDTAHDGRRLRGMIATGLSTLPGFRGRGFGQLNYVAQAERQLALGHDFAFAWFDADRHAPGTSHHTYTGPNTRAEFAYHCPIYAKAIDIQTLWWLGMMRRRDRWAAKLVLRFFPLRQALHSRFSLHTFTGDDAPGCVAFIAARHRSTLRRIVSPEEFARRYGYQQERITGRAWLLMAGDDLVGLAYGYTNPLVAGAAYFALDGLLFTRRVGYGMRRRFMAAVEHRCRHELGCCAVLAPPTVYAGSLGVLGYVPLARHTLGAHTFNDATGLTEAHLRTLLLELR